MKRRKALDRVLILVMSDIVTSSLKKWLDLVKRRGLLALFSKDFGLLDPETLARTITYIVMDPERIFGQQRSNGVREVKDRSNGVREDNVRSNVSFFTFFVYSVRQ